MGNQVCSVILSEAKNHSEGEAGHTRRSCLVMDILSSAVILRCAQNDKPTILPNAKDLCFLGHSVRVKATKLAGQQNEPFVRIYCNKLMNDLGCGRVGRT